MGVMGAQTGASVVSRQSAAQWPAGLTAGGRAGCRPVGGSAAHASKVWGLPRIWCRVHLAEHGSYTYAT